MTIQITSLAKKDQDKAINFAIKGMNFERYLTNPFLLKLYGRYFWYLESQKATDIIAAYADGKFVGVLLAQIYDQKPRVTSLFKSLYIQTFEWLQTIFFEETKSGYDMVNQQMLANYKKTAQVDGEIVFLAADPDNPVKGIGSALLAELEKRYPSKNIYLYTDQGCTYQFYEARGFEKVGHQTATLDILGKKQDLNCFMYSKVLGNTGNN